MSPPLLSIKDERMSSLLCGSKKASLNVIHYLNKAKFMPFAENFTESWDLR